MLPLAAGSLARIDSIQQWAAAETARILHEELALEARYDLYLQPWPPRLVLTNVSIDASDGGEAFLRADEIVATPKIFSLLAGEMNLGEVHIEQPRLRVVVRNGRLHNLALKPRGSETDDHEEPPLRSLSITNAKLLLDIGAVQIRSSAIDLDLSLESGSIELFLRSGESQIDTQHGGRHDEDVLCRIELRARIDRDGKRVLIRRLNLEGSADFDPRRHTRPGCALPEGDWRRVKLNLAGIDAQIAGGTLQRITGRASGRLPVPIVHRFFDAAATTGFVTFEVDELSYMKGQALPTLRGRFGGKELGVASKYVARSLDGSISIDDDRIRIEDTTLTWGGGHAHIKRADVFPTRPGIPLAVEGLTIDHVTLEDLLDDLGGFSRAHVSWLLDDTRVARFGGTLSPLDLSGPLDARTRNFRVYDRPYDAANKRTMLAVDEARVFGQFKVTEDAVVLAGFEIVTPGARSRLQTTVSLGYEALLGINISEGSHIDLEDVSPIADIDLAGVAELSVVGGGPFNHPRLSGSVAIEGFRFAGFPVGNIAASRFQFAPLQVLFEHIQLNQGQSEIAVPSLDVNFGDGDAGVVLSARVDTRKGARCTTRCRLALIDFYRMVKLDSDPRFTAYEVGNLAGTADIHFVSGGSRDPCGNGRLRVRSQMSLADISLYQEGFDRGVADFDFVWDDIIAGSRGMYIDVHSAVLHKGRGTVMGRASIRHGGWLQADVTGSAIPLSTLTAYQRAYGMRARQSGDVRPEANLAFVGSVSGSLERIIGQFDIDMSPLRIGPSNFPASRFRVDWLPSELPPESVGRSRCGNSIPPPDEATAGRARQPRQAGRSEDLLKLSGTLFGNQISFDDLRILRQRSDIMSGDIKLTALDLGALANLVPGVAFTASPPEGSLSGTLRLGELDLDAPAKAELTLSLSEAEIARRGDVYRIAAVAKPFRMSGEQLEIPDFVVKADFKSGFSAEVLVHGRVSQLSGDPKLNIDIHLAPVNLAKIGLDVAQIKRAAGELTAGLEIGGSMARPDVTGHIDLQAGFFSLQDMPLSFDDVTVALHIKDGEIHIQRADAKIGSSGSVSLRGRASLDGLGIGGASLSLTAREVKLPLADGVKMTADAALQIDYTAQRGDEQAGPRALPNVTGQVTLASFSYTRPMRFTVDLDQLTSKKRTIVDTYDPADDNLTFDIILRSPRPLRIANNLIDMRMRVNQPGLRISGTDQRYGARGTLSIDKGSKLSLQGHRFDVRDGRVEFDNPSRIAPKLDVRAVTEYRRFASSADIDTSTTTSEGSGGNTAGSWRITMHAHGDTDAPKLRFTSEPALQQDDIVLLLQVGMTRAELDRGFASSLAQTVGLEALSAATGFDQAVRSTVPLIDEFRIGSQYSSRSGRPEPTLSVGKRLTDNVRATVTTGLSENREVRSNIEWKLRRGLSIEGLYDNVNDVSSSALGNVGADLRWRLEFD
jgi:translocation and assembly module TamB